MNLVLRKLESAKISKEASQVLAASEATEGITFGEMLEQSWQNLTFIIDICHMPAVNFHVE